jgi:hypothetical protein
MMATQIQISHVTHFQYAIQEQQGGSRWAWARSTVNQNRVFHGEQFKMNPIQEKFRRELPRAEDGPTANGAFKKQKFWNLQISQTALIFMYMH